ncbi:MAG TPA: flagellar hook assembly protein FlgD [Firmicutes bacterium]|nr:flagellar hook assembly protein FlgD [Bacillota bacterium]HHT42796.1 flagellar hook assembly protein FlgD [Bacillota bacterium]
MYVNTVGSVDDLLRQREGVERDPSALGKDQFLKLLITQLKHQDPISPVEDKEFIAQLAQFSSLEQMQNLNTNLSDMMLAQQKLTSLGQAMQMIGKEVELFTKEGENLFGRVTGVQFKNGWPEIIVGGKLYDFTEVAAIREEVKDDSTV